MTLRHTETQRHIEEREPKPHLHPNSYPHPTGGVITTLTVCLPASDRASAPTNVNKNAALHTGVEIARRWKESPCWRPVVTTSPKLKLKFLAAALSSRNHCKLERTYWFAPRGHETFQTIREILAAALWPRNQSKD